MARMTMTYKAEIGELGPELIKETIASCVKTHGKRYGIHQIFENDDTKYLTNSPVTAITISDNGEIQISETDGNRRAIKKARSKLLKMVRGLELD